MSLEAWAAAHFDTPPPPRGPLHAFPDGRSICQESKHAFDCNHHLQQCDCPGPRWVEEQMKQPTVAVPLHVLQLIEAHFTDGVHIDAESALALIREGKKRCKPCL